MENLILSGNIPSGNPPRVRTRGAAGRAMKRLRGFTFVEIMVVVTIMVILISMAIPIYNRSIIRAKESVLKNNLFTLRTVIDNYTSDKQKAPQTLQDLVTEGYLQKIPVDPMTASNQTWRTVMEDASQSVSQSEPGIFDVNSGSDKMGLDGTAYRDW
jgi:general secretion pathway protein G